MKTPIKNLFVAFIIIFFFSACQQFEDFIEPEVRQSRIQEVNLVDDPHLQDLVNGINDQYNINGRTNSLLDKVDFSSANKHYDSANHSTKYTFSMIEEDLYSLQNFILIEPDNGEISGFVFTHTLDLDWYSQQDSFPGLDQYTGLFSIQDLDGNLIAENKIINGSSIESSNENGRISGTTCVTEYFLVTETQDVTVKTAGGTSTVTNIIDQYVVTETTCYSGGGSTDSPNDQITQELDYVRGDNDFPPLGDDCGLNSTYNAETNTCDCKNGFEKDGDDNCIAIVKTPCEFINELGENQGFLEKMTILRNSATSDNFEKGYVLHSPNNNNYQYDYVEGIPNKEEIEFDIHGINDGFIHSHYSGLLSIFSPHDIKTMYTFFNNDHIRDVKNFFLGVTTAQGTTYALMIDNPVSFANFGHDWFSNEIMFNHFKRSYKSVFNITEDGLADDNELHFIELLNSTNSGLVLYKKENGKWNRKALRNNQIGNSNCN